MEAPSKSVLAFLALVSVLLSPLVYQLPFGQAQSGTNVSYILSQDTTWTTSGSPYTLTGNTLVYQGVTLTIHPGVTVNLGSYYIEVNGTLSAVGSQANKITFNGGQITFTASSSGGRFENVNLETDISTATPLNIDSCNITGQITGPNLTVTNCVINGQIQAQIISNEDALQSESSVISDNVVTGQINIGYFYFDAISGDTSTVFNNSVNGSITVISSEGTPQIYNNTVSGGGIQCTGYGSILNNYVYGCQEGISLYTVRVFGGEFPCYATVENNLVVDNSHGIDIELTSVFVAGTICPTISSNTIFGNSVGIYLSESNYNSTPIIENNNIQNNSDYNFYLQAPNNVNASYDWWGTTSQQAINRTIYDFKEDFNLGTVNFVPFLMAFNSQAPSVNTVMATPTPSPTQSSTSTPSQTPTPSSTVPELSWLAIVPLLLSVFSVAVIVVIEKTVNLGTQMQATKKALQSCHFGRA